MSNVELRNVESATGGSSLRCDIEVVGGWCRADKETKDGYKNAKYIDQIPDNMV